MILLTSTSDELRLVTTTDATLDVKVAWRDLASGVVTLGRANTLVSTATTTTIVASPGASTSRNVSHVSIRNRHASQGCTVTVVHRASGPVDVELLSIRMRPGQQLIFEEHEGWRLMRAVYGNLWCKGDQVYTAPTVGVLYTTVLEEDYVNNGATANRLRDVDQLGFPVTQGHRYWFRFSVPYTSAATGTGARFTIYGPGSTTALRYRSEYSLTTTTTTVNQGVLAYDTPTGSNATSAATAANMAIVEGFIDTPTTDGRVILRFANEVAGSAVTVKRGAKVEWMRVS